MGSIQQFPVTQTTEGALLSICAENSFSKCALMQPASRQGCDICPAYFCNLIHFALRLREYICVESIVDSNGKDKIIWRVLDHIYRPHY